MLVENKDVEYVRSDLHSGSYMLSEWEQAVSSYRKSTRSARPPTAERKTNDWSRENHKVDASHVCDLSDLSLVCSTLIIFLVLLFCLLLVKKATYGDWILTDPSVLLCFRRSAKDKDKEESIFWCIIVILKYISRDTYMYTYKVFVCNQDSHRDIPYFCWGTWI